MSTNSVSENYYKILQNTEEIYHYIELGDKQKALIGLQELLKLHNCPIVILEEWKNYLTRLNSNIRKSACIGGLDFIDSLIISLNFTFKLKKLRQISEIHQHLSQTVGLYAQAVFESKCFNSTGLTKKVCEYIQQNYKKNISTKQIAKKFNVQDLHLSRQFKKDIKISVTQYIQLKRIAEAKRLLKLNKYSIKEVAEIVGFDNEQYFIKIFKNLELTSPKKYLYSYE
ncbi:helix-turn-helix transcriptional regulator [Clostridium sp. 'deep sea']|uniref:helix-turn-helix transcriptional regulator n=1 Tax=Clostridium sp. 'deep sea' TaxID=2779445 RepID=UPI0018965777|nr:helix-turn-helix transcriptional regulator [Clostridium sp. 'deep sea']QOR36809.1 helix-turn-helix transcriptional regulator [Clostridium sp. 'deep sea']